MEDVAENEHLDEYQRLSRAVDESIALGDLDRALRLAVEGASHFDDSHDLAGRALASNLVGKCYRLLNDLPASIENHQKSYETYTALHDLRGSAEALRMKAISLRTVGRDEDAIRDLQQSRTLCREAGDRAQEMRTLTSLSVLYKQVGDVASSQELLFECLAYFEQNGPMNQAAPVLLNIASNYNNVDDPARAVLFARRGIKLFEAAEDMRSISMALCVLGNCYAMLGDFETALEQYRASFHVAEHVDNRATLPLALNGMSDMLMEQKRFDEARDVLERSIHLNRGDGFRIAYGGNLTKLGQLYANPEYAEQDIDNALGYLKEAQQIAEQNDYVISLGDIHETLTGLYERLGDHARALESFRAFHATRMRLVNEDSNARIKRLELEKAEKEAEITRLRLVELAQALEEAERLRVIADAWARTDPLTGVLNRRALDEYLEEEFERSRRHARSFAVALVDVDHFKRVNDTLGHGSGDNVLCHVAHLLQTHCGSGNRIARYGGEEFVLLFPEADQSAALEVCECLRAAVATEDWTKIHPNLSSLTVSIGVGVFDERGRERFDAPAALLDAADKNLYQAKRDGRNRVVG